MLSAERMEPFNVIDPKCPEAETSGKSLEARLEMEGLEGEAYAREFLRRYNDFAVHHVPTCARCRSYRPDEDARKEDTRSPIWGGATLGLLIGLLVGFFRASYWQTVLYSVAIGAALGVAANWIGLVGSLLLWADRRARRK
jgi:hypothetical protein